MGSYRFIYIYIIYLNIVGRTGIHPTKIPKTVIRIFKISVFVHIYAHGRTGGRAGRVPQFFAHP